MDLVEKHGPELHEVGNVFNLWSRRYTSVISKFAAWNIGMLDCGNWTTAKIIGSLMIYCKKDNKFPLMLKERRKIARLLYGDMYTAFAG